MIDVGFYGKNRYMKRPAIFCVLNILFMILEINIYMDVNIANCYKL